MNLRAKALSAAFLSVALIAFGSNLALRPAWYEGFLWAAPLDPSSAEAVDLTLVLPDQNQSLQFSTQSEVLRFELHAEEPYTLRYATVAVRSSGLVLPSTPADWKVYEVHDGRVDFSQPVGYGETWDDSFLKLRFAPDSPAVGYLAPSGVGHFALVTSVLKDDTSQETPLLSAQFPTVLPSGFDWAFVGGAETRPWMDVGECFGAELLKGLSNGSVDKHW